MCVCLCVRACARVCVGVGVGVGVFVCVNTKNCMDVLNVWTLVYPSCVCTSTALGLHTSIRMSVHTNHTYTFSNNMYRYIYIYIHVYICIHIYMCVHCVHKPIGARDGIMRGVFTVGQIFNFKP